MCSPGGARPSSLFATARKLGVQLLGAGPASCCRNVRNLCAQKDMHSGMLTVKPATKQTLRQQLVALRRSVLALHLGQQLVHVNLERSALYNTISKHRDPEHELLAGCNQHMQQLRSNMLPTMTTCDMSLAEPCAPPPVRPSVRPSVRPCVRLSVRPCVRLSVSLRLCASLTRIKPPGHLGRSGCESRQRCFAIVKATAIKPSLCLSASASACSCGCVSVCLSRPASLCLFLRLVFMRARHHREA